MLTINPSEIVETIKMIRDEHLDIRTITMGISLLDCADSNIDKACQKVYDKITKYAKNLVSVGKEIEKGTYDLDVEDYLKKVDVNE